MSKKSRWLSLGFSLSVHLVLFLGLTIMSQENPSYSSDPIELKIIDRSPRAHELASTKKPLPPSPSKKKHPSAMLAQKNSPKQSKLALEKTGKKGFRIRPARSGKRLKLLHSPAHAEYPQIARQLGKQGEVVLEFSVSSAGNVENIRVIRYSGHASFIAAAKKALSKHKFVPGARVAKVLKTFVFKL